MSSRLLLVPLDDVVVFPGMSLTLAVDAGEEERVLLVPSHDTNSPRSARSPRSPIASGCPAALAPSSLQGLHRGVAGAAHTDPDGRLFVEVEERPDPVPVDGKTRNLEREYRAVVEEILELRGDDGRVSRRSCASITEPGALADTGGYSPDLSYEQQGQAAPDARRHRAARARPRLPARAAGRAAGPQADPRRRRVRRREAAARVLPAQADGVDPQGARRGRRVGRRGVPDEDRRGRDARGRARAGRQGARPARADRRAVGRVERDPDLPRLADRGPVEQALG